VLTLFHFIDVTIETHRIDVRWLSVDNIDSSSDVMENASRNQFVKVAPPTVHAGVGEALRRAYSMNCEQKSLKIFEDLLARLDKSSDPDPG